jgi:hypothetical protein
MNMCGQSTVVKRRKPGFLRKFKKEKKLIDIRFCFWFSMDLELHSGRS